MTDIPKGITLINDVISEKYEEKVIHWIDSQNWVCNISRRTQHYGYEYNYITKDIKKTISFSGKLLKIQNELSNILEIDQCIINEYKNNQGIAPHIDSLIFGPTVASLSLNNDTVMTFNYKDKFYDCFVPKRSLLILQDDARYKWTHSISKNTTVSYLDKKLVKQKNYRRISLTFRKVN